MDAKFKERYMALLNKHEQNIKRTLELMKENRNEQNEGYPQELSNYDNHPAELGSDVQQITINNALLVHEKYMLNEIYEAKKRINNDEYGKCQLCGNEIGEERLEAVPYARLCIECEEKGQPDPQVRKLDRPVEELIWDAPFGRKYLNQREDDENEGMDQLNDLIKYGSSDTPQDMGGYHDYDDYYTNKIDKQGIVDDMDQVTNEEYRRQLPD